MSKPDPRIDAILTKLNKLDSLDSVISKLDSLTATVNNISTVVDDLKVKVESNTTKIEDLKEDYEKFKKETAAELRSVKNTLNAREQQLRGNTIRLFNYPTGKDEAAGLLNRIYDRILRPILAAAKSAGDLTSVPQAHNAVEACYRAFTQVEPAEGAAPAPIVIRFASRPLKIAVLKHKKQHMPEPSEGERCAGAKRFVMVDDLTPPAHKLLKALQADSRTDKVWSVNGHICFSIPGKKGFKKVRSVFESVDSILA